MQEQIIDIRTRAGEMETFICHPDRNGPHPVVFMLMDAPGIRQELRDFAKVRLKGGETRSVRFVLPARAFSYLDEDQNSLLYAGVIQLHVGASARACELGT